jgi:thiosulfate/3-mercaptopyruvate sulfurtransferase
MIAATTEERDAMPADPFIDAAALAGLGPVRYLDARDQAAFEAGAAPNAVRVASEAWDVAAKAADVGFGNVAHWQRTIGALGLDGTTLAAVYDNGGMTNAARVWFILQHFGAPAVIINGGWPAIAAAGALPAGLPASGSPFQARPGAGAVGLIERVALRDQLGEQAQVFDTRTPREFSGEDQRRNPRGGHLPGARNLSHTALMRDGHVHAEPVLRAMLRDVGFQDSDRIVTHCEGGGRAALAAAAAVRAGFGDVRVYYHSFSDWSRDESCPVVRD